MNYFNKKNVIILVIAVLLIINIAAIGTIIYLTYHKPPILPPPVEKLQPESFMKMWDDLDLTPEQKKSFFDYKKEYRDQTREILEQLQQKRIQMMDVFSKEDPVDSAELYKLAKESGVLHEKLKIITINHLLDIKGVCTPEQFKCLEGIFRTKIMGNGPKEKHPFNRWQKGRVPKKRNNNPLPEQGQ